MNNTAWLYYKTTQWSCITCGMSVYALNRARFADNPMRRPSCLQENLMASPGGPLIYQSSIPCILPKFYQVPFDMSGYEYDGFVESSNRTTNNKCKLTMMFDINNK